MKSVKETLLDLAIADTESQIETAERGRKDSVEESKAHKGAMASRYDTFKEEAQYLAGGFASRIKELSSQRTTLKSMQMRLAANRKISGGAIVEVEDVYTSVKTKYFLLPVGGGNMYEVNGEQYSILTIQAPLAHILLGKTEGNEVEITIQGTTKHLFIVSIS